MLFVQSLQPIKQNADNVTGKGLACYSRGEQTVTVEEMITFQFCVPYNYTATSTKKVTRTNGSNDNRDCISSSPRDYLSDNRR